MVVDVRVVVVVVRLQQRRARTRHRRRPSPNSIQPPIATIEMAAMTGAERTTVSGGRNPWAPTTTAASTRIPSVCETVTDSPSPAAWSGVPRVPTR